MRLRRNLMQIFAAQALRCVDVSVLQGGASRLDIVDTGMTTPTSNIGKRNAAAIRSAMTAAHIGDREALSILAHIENLAVDQCRIILAGDQ